MNENLKDQSVLRTELYRKLLLIRRSQEILMDEYHPADEMRCPIHFCVGQEAAPAALSPLLRNDDVIMTHHRSHGYYLAKGAPLDAMVAEFYGKSTGSNGGLAGSQELSKPDKNFFSGTILSGMFAMATGAAFSQTYKDTDDFTVAVIGDGAMEEGIVFEALNIAAVFNLPVLFLCENNFYSAFTRIDRRAMSENLVGRVSGFGVETHILDGNDPLLLHNHFSDFVSRIRKGNGPIFVEVSTYRTRGHVGPENDDIFNYRSTEELDKWLDRDPVRTMRSALKASGVSEAEVAKIEKEVDETVHASISKAKADPFPAFEDAVSYNWAGTFSPILETLPEGSSAEFDGAQEETKVAPY